MTASLLPQQHLCRAKVVATRLRCSSSRSEHVASGAQSWVARSHLTGCLCLASALLWDVLARQSDHHCCSTTPVGHISCTRCIMVASLEV